MQSPHRPSSNMKCNTSSSKGFHARSNSVTSNCSPRTELPSPACASKVAAYEPWPRTQRSASTISSELGRNTVGDQAYVLGKYLHINPQPGGMHLVLHGMKPSRVSPNPALLVPS